jgi:hypothetical protein
VAITVGACTDISSPPAPAHNDPGAAPQVDVSALRGVDREFARIAGEIPGFGGMFRAPDGSAIVYLTDLLQSGHARGVLARRRAFAGIDPARIEIRHADYDFASLANWRQRVRTRIPTTGLVYLDIDEASNRLRIGVLKGVSHAAISSQIGTFGVPAGGVVVEDAEPMKFTATLRDRVRPVAGGLQIVWPGGPGDALFVCTIGFNARRANDPAEYFVTNSHCSGQQGGVQTTPFFQAIPGEQNLIAREVLDPPYSAENCFPGLVCRFSDAALARYVSGVPVAYGKIARTTLRGLTAGSLTIDSLNPQFTIRGRQPFALFGQTIDKLGRTTGWTVGTVVFTCADFLVSGTEIALLCQDAALSGVAGGDSGSPVFTSGPFTSNDVSLYGILWGGGGTNFGPLFAFSPLENIEFELGALRVTIGE